MRGQPYKQQKSFDIMQYDAACRRCSVFKKTFRRETACSARKLFTPTHRTQSSDWLFPQDVVDSIFTMLPPIGNRPCTSHEAPPLNFAQLPSPWIMETLYNTQKQDLKLTVKAYATITDDPPQVLRSPPLMQSKLHAAQSSSLTQLLDRWLARHAERSRDY